jgi:hypothetical protein
MTRPLKFRNKPVTVDGIRFDSKAEARRYGELKLLERTGKISDLKLQDTFDLPVNGVVVCSYRADFTYVEDDNLVVEDVKSAATSKNPVYRIKKKLMKVVHGIDIREVA